MLCRASKKGYGPLGLESIADCLIISTIPSTASSTGRWSSCGLLHVGYKSHIWKGGKECKISKRFTVTKESHASTRR